ncbi:MAG: preprotein translocase subunit SecE [Clostridiales bacterium]|nr:preprotein translocase subunit SecE [Clostridiales bacterium]
MADDQIKTPETDASEEVVEQKAKTDKKADEQVKAPKADKSERKPEQKNKKGKNAKKKEPGKVRRWFKDFFSELKKVTWPTFGKVLKQLGTVLLVTVCFLLVTLAFDSLLGFLYEKLLGGLSEESVVIMSLLSGGGLL